MAYIGHSPSTGEDNNFKILDDISSYTLTFDGSDSSVVSTSDETIYSYNHRFVQGQRVKYTNGGGGDINGLTNNSYYFIIKQDHNNIKLATSASNASDGTAVNITAVGSGSSHTLNVAFDGVNTKFKATHTTGQKARITRGAQLVLSVNGVIQQPHDSATPSTGFGFDLDGTIVFSQAPQSTDAFWGHILTNNNVTFDISDNRVDHFSGDGSTSSFTLSKSPPNNENILVTIDGVVQYPNDGAGNIRAYSVDANVINFTTAPGSGTQIEVRHIGFAGASGGGGGGVTGFYGRTGNVTLVNTDNITVNDAAITGDATITGDLTVNGTTTTLDTNLIDVDKIEVATTGNIVAVAVTQSGSSDLVRLYDGASQVVTVDDTGKVGINSSSPGQKLDVAGAILTRSTNNTAKFQHNALKFQTSGSGHIDHETTNQNLNFRVTKSSTSDTTMMQINAASEQTKFHKIVTVGLQGGSDTTQIGGGSGIGAYLQLNYANNSIVNTKLLGNGDSWLNSHYGSLGIGTQTPARKVEIFDTAATVLQLNSTNTGGTSLRIQNSGTDKMFMGLAGDFIVGQGSNVTDSAIRASGALLVSTGGGTERLRIDSNGRLGIGVTNPSANFVVSNAGANGFEFNPNFNSNNSIIASYNRTGSGSYSQLTLSASQHIFSQGGTEYGRFNASGRLGIGTDNPTSKLTVFGGSIGSGAIDALELKHASANNSGDGTSLLFNALYQNNPWAYAKISAVNSGTGFGGDLQVHIHPADGTQGSSVVQALSIVGDGSDGAKIRIPNGIVGIGTDNPVSALDVRNASGTNPLLSLHHSEADVEGEVVRVGRVAPYHTIRYHSIKAKHGGAVANNYLSFSLHDGTGSPPIGQKEVMRLRGDGKVGIGTTIPTYMLHVDSGDAAIGLWKSRRSSGSYIEYAVGANGAQLGFIGAGGQIIASGADSGDFAIRSEGDLCFASGGSTEKLRIESGGGLKFTGQGSSIPVGGILHHTNNNLYVRGGTNGCILGNQDNTTTVQIYNGYIKFETDDGTEKVRITSEGVLQIGNLQTSQNSTTHTSATKLHIDSTKSIKIARLAAGNITSAGWFTVAKVAASNGNYFKCYASIGGDFTADMCVIELTASFSASGALQNTYTEPVFKAYRTGSHSTDRITRARLVKDGSNLLYLQIYIAGGVNSNTFGKSVLEYQIGAYSQNTADSGSAAMFAAQASGLTGLRTLEVDDNAICVSSGSHKFYSGGNTAERLTINANGQVIISNSNPPATGSMMHVTDDGSATTMGTSSTFRVSNDGSSASYSVFEAESAQAGIRLSNSGRTLIGDHIANPAATLHVIGKNNDGIHPIAQFGKDGEGRYARFNSINNQQNFDHLLLRRYDNSTGDVLRLQNTYASGTGWGTGIAWYGHGGNVTGRIKVVNATTDSSVARMHLEVNNQSIIHMDHAPNRVMVGEPASAGGFHDSAPLQSRSSQSNTGCFTGKSANYATAFGILPWHTGGTLISSGVTYNNGGWTHISDGNRNCLWYLKPNGWRWYASDSGSANWNVASDVGIMNGAGQWTGGTSSDRRLKDNITNMNTTDALTKVTQLQGVSYTWKDEAQKKFGSAPYPSGTHYGFIAQDVKTVWPEAHIITQTDDESEFDRDPTKDVKDDVYYGDIEGVKMEKMVPLLVEAIKELKKENDALKARITTLEG